MIFDRFHPADGNKCTIEWFLVVSVGYKTSLVIKSHSTHLPDPFDHQFTSVLYSFYSNLSFTWSLSIFKFFYSHFLTVSPPKQLPLRTSSKRHMSSTTCVSVFILYRSSKWSFQVLRTSFSIPTFILYPLFYCNSPSLHDSLYLLPSKTTLYLFPPTP